MGCVWIVRLCYCGFGLAEATLSPTRISRHPDQTGNLHSVVHEKGILLAHIKVSKTGATVHVCVLCFKFLAPQKSLLQHSCVCSLLFVHLESMICCFWPHRARIDTHLFLMVKWIAFHVCGCPWIAASSIWYLQYLLNQWELHWKPLSYHHHWSFSPEDLWGFKLDTFSFQHVLWLFQSYSVWENRFSSSTVQRVLSSAAPTTDLCTFWCVTQLCARNHGPSQRTA